MDDTTSVALSGMLAIAGGCFAVFAFFRPDANSVIRAYDSMWRAMTFPRSLDHRVMYLIGGLVAIAIGLIALADASGIIRLPRR